MKTAAPLTQPPSLRRWHRLLVPVAAAPLLLTALTGSLYSVLLEHGIDAFWLVKLHTGHFGSLNLQPYYAILLGLLTMVVVISGLGLLIGPRRGDRPGAWPDPMRAFIRRQR